MVPVVLYQFIMSLIKTYLHWVESEENQEVFQQLPQREVWKPIKDFPGYEVSSFGRVRSYKGRTLRVMRPGTTPGGYQTITLRRDNQSYVFSLHRVVGETYHPNPNNLPVVRHLDNNKTHNHKDNLCWGTQSQNIRQSYEEGRQTWSLPESITWCVTSPEGVIHTTDNLTEFSRQQNLDRSLLTKVVRGHRPKHKGWTSLSCPLVL